MSKKFVIAPLCATLALSLGGCYAHDRNTYTASVDEMKTALVGKTNTYKTKTATHGMTVTGAAPRGVSVMLFTNGKPGQECSIVLEEVDESTTRARPSCGTQSSAQAKVLSDILEAKIAEHTKEILTGEPVDVAFLLTKMSGAAMKQLPAMQKEALEMDRQMRAYQKDAERAAGGWGSE